MLHLTSLPLLSLPPSPCPVGSPPLSHKANYVAKVFAARGDNFAAYLRFTPLFDPPSPPVALLPAACRNCVPHCRPLILVSVRATTTTTTEAGMGAGQQLGSFFGSFHINLVDFCVN